MPDLVWIIAAVLTLLGAIGLWLGLRGRRLNDHPICRKCKFDLVGVYPPESTSAGGTGVSPVRTNEDSPRCPECGRDLKRKRAVRHGARRRRPFVVIVAILLLTCGLTGLGAAGWSSARNIDWNHHKPEWMLLQAVRDGDGAVDPGVLREFLRRDKQGSLSDRTLQSLATYALGAQSAVRKPEREHGMRRNWSHDRNEWSDEWGVLFQRAMSRDVVSEGAVIRYLANSMDRALTSHPSVPQGGQLRFNLSYQTDLVGLDAGPLIVHGQITAVSIDGETIARDLAPFIVRLSNHSGGYGTRVRIALPDVSTGMRTVRFALRHQYFENCGGVLKPHDHVIQPRVEWYEIDEFRVLVQPAGAPDIELFVDEALRGNMNAVARSLFSQIEVVGDRWAVEGDASSRFQSFPASVCADVILKTSEGEHVFNRIIKTPHDGGVSMFAMEPVFPTDDDTVDIILRPNLEHAERFLAIDRAWGEDIVIENVPVKRISAEEARAAAEARMREIQERIQKQRKALQETKAENQKP